MMVILCVSATGECISAFAKMDFKATGIPAWVRIETLNSFPFLYIDFTPHTFLSFVFCQNMVLYFSVMTSLTCV